MNQDDTLTFREPISGHTYRFDFANKTLTNWFERRDGTMATPYPSALDPFSEGGVKLVAWFVTDLYAEGYEKVI
ncbi:hypothetical protein KASHIRA_02390 [Serratia phage vB_SmaM-Kashira]|nr:hypothetical protein KASHIRA_02390 [Serratia phage vB_SmaM-Kashira]